MNLLNRHALSAWPAGAVYIGRGTAFGNPYAIGEHGDRDTVCDQYEDWLTYKVSQRDPVIMTALLGLKPDSQLVCSCVPARCHGESIIKAWARLQEQGLPSSPRTMTYAGIGSRKTPADILERMTAAATRLASAGYTLRSGAAQGADTAFEIGAGANKEIYLPWTNFNNNASPLHTPSREAEQIAEVLHPAWAKLLPAAKKLMARNSHQILGTDLKSPVDFVVCFTPDGAERESERSYTTGGTGQAISLASRWGIPVFNFARPDAGERLLAFVKAAKGSVNISPGSIFDTPVRALVNPVNCVGAMGKGLALEFKQRFPDAYESYRIDCASGALRPGKLHIYHAPNDRWIVHFPTKDHWRDASRMEYIEAGLPVLVDWAKQNAIESIGIPALGCGLGGLPWVQIKAKIEAAFAGAGVTRVLLFPHQE